MTNWVLDLQEMNLSQNFRLNANLGFFPLGLSDCCCLRLKSFSKVENSEYYSEVSRKYTHPFFTACKKKSQKWGKLELFQEAGLPVC